MQPRSCINEPNLKTGLKKTSSCQIRGFRKKINQKGTKSYITSLSTLGRANYSLSVGAATYVSKKEGGKISEDKSKDGKISESVLDINERTISLSK
ncbi:MAG TPA: hypothetical protein IGR89_06575 [Oscillatoriaceae cyanobacterium M7585_C2015_266]|nr:hypothetical protein [Oscillatoriaceae cyanobacterium M7585_C2015_266]